MAVVPVPSALGKSTHDRTFPRRRSLELKHRDSREPRNFRRDFRISYEFFLELVQLAKHRKRLLLAARDVAGRQCIPNCISCC